jgi:hypothetical protein
MVKIPHDLQAENTANLRFKGLRSRKVSLPSDIIAEWCERAHKVNDARALAGINEAAMLAQSQLPIFHSVQIYCVTWAEPPFGWIQWGKAQRAKKSAFIAQLHPKARAQQTHTHTLAHTLPPT